MDDRTHPFGINGDKIPTVYDIARMHIPAQGEQEFGFTFETDFGRTMTWFGNRQRISSTKQSERGEAVVKLEPMTEVIPNVNESVRIEMANNGIIDTFNEFTQSTTFHGIRYIFNPKSWKLRKAIWMFVVAIAVTLFSYQVVDRCLYFFEYNTNINVEVVYADSVQFPSITFCNQNNYRISEAVRNNMYDFIDFIYSQDNLTGINHTDYKVTNLELENFISQTAHSMDDFVDRCQWKGLPCDFNTDFKMTLTDFGVCYTFNNANDSTVRNITKSGSGFALSLVLNIEQYEYMKGPHDEAGMKVLLHDAGEAPLVDDLGFALAPGTHVLLAVQMRQVLSLETPYGTCVPGAMPRSQCITRCRAEKLYETCSCVDAYMLDSTDNYTICSVEASLICGRQYKAESVQKENNCVCHVPCTRISYRPELSYAHLSKLNVDKIWQGHPERKLRVKKKFVEAREVFDRVNIEQANSDKSLFLAIQTTTNKHVESVLSAGKIIHQAEMLESIMGVPYSPLELIDSLMNDLDTIADVTVELRGELTSESPAYSEIIKFARKIRYGFIFDYSWDNDIWEHGLTVQILQKCSDQENNITGTYDLEDYEYYDCTDDLSGAASYLSNAKTCAASEAYDTNTGSYYCRETTIIQDTNATYHAALNEKQIYIDKIHKVFGNTSRYDDILISGDYKTCVEKIEESEEIWNILLKNIVSTLSDYYNATSWTEKLNLASEIEDIYFKNITGTLLNKTLFNECNWYHHDYDYYHNDKAWTDYQDFSQLTRNSLTELQNTDHIIDTGKKVYVYISQRSPALVDPFIAYLEGNMTKTNLYENVTSDLYRNTDGEVTIKHESYVSTMETFASKLMEVENNLRHTFDAAHNLTIPVMTHDVTSKFEFVEKLVGKYTHKNKSAIIEIFNSMGDDVGGALNMLLDNSFGTFRRGIESKISNLNHQLVARRHAGSAVRHQLSTFMDDSELNEQFFMRNYVKIDIFYKELSYTKVRQQKSFEFISLLSEVGGFLGLLLGASVLTVCELVDYLALTTMRKIRKAKQVEPKITDGYYDPMRKTKSVLDSFDG